MSNPNELLSPYPSTGHLVLVRGYDAQGGLLAVIPNLPEEAVALRVLHGLMGKNGLVGPQEAPRGLETCRALNAEKGRAFDLLQRAAKEAVELRAVASPVAGLAERVATRSGDKADVAAFMELLNQGAVRAAEKVNGVWQPQPYCMEGILNCFKVLENRRMEEDHWDKIPLKTTSLTDQDFINGGVRYCPGSRVRDGAYLGSGTVVMNMAFVNIGAYVAGGGTMLDGGTRVASAAQLGKNVKFGGGSGIEGVLEPAGRLPSIIEDNAKIGAMVEVSGIVGEGAVVASGVIMATGKKIYDEATGQVIPPISIPVGERVYQVPHIPPYRLAVGGSLLSEKGTFATGCIVLKPGDLRERSTMKHFEKQGLLYE